MGYIITAILTALGCYVWHSLRVATLDKLLASAYEELWYLREKVTVVDEAVRLLDLQRYRTQYKQDDQLVTQKQVAAFIERYK